MQPAPIPGNDKERLAALHALLILDTPPEERFDRITEFAAAEFDVPIALISLIDEKRQWFKSKFGIDACDTARDISFCGHAIVQPEIFIISDATADPRFADNPAVIGEPFVRFYAGAPLVMPSGFAVGTLCLADCKSRQLDEIELSILKILRDLVVYELIEKGSSLRENDSASG